jgi:hypothetical protein
MTPDATDLDRHAEFVEDSLLSTAARCVRGARLTRRDAAVLMRDARDVIKQLRAQVAGQAAQIDLLAVAHQALFDHYVNCDCTQCLGGGDDEDDDDEDDDLDTDDDMDDDAAPHAPLPGQMNFPGIDDTSTEDDE